MSRRKAILVAFIVIAAGVALALPFRKPAASRSAQPIGVMASTASDSAAAEDDIARGTLSGRIEPLDDGRGRTGGGTSAFAVSHSSAAAPTDDHTAAAASAPAGLPAQYPDNPTAGDHRAEPSGADDALASDAPPVWTHKVVDGDTLPKLAERFLGSPDRAGEIFACNRDLLADPDMLPIGVELRIPNRKAPPPVSAAPQATPGGFVGFPRPAGGASAEPPVAAPIPLPPIGP